MANTATPPNIAPEPPHERVTVLSALPVGVWRTYQTVDDLPAREEPLTATTSTPAKAGKDGGLLLSACLIVRDEERRLAGCLESIAPLVDEIVVIDTGSRDRSMEIARGYKARVFELPWTGDFGAARNEALEHARGEWILQIDADEVVQPFPRARLRQLLSAVDVCAYYVLLRRHPGLTPNWQMKLFRRHPEARHSAVIHESIPPSLLRAATGMRTGCFPMLVEHTGYLGDQRPKYARNLPLLLRLLEDKPDHPDKAFIWSHAADIYEATGNDGLAASARKCSLRALAAKNELHPVDCAIHLGQLSRLVAGRLDAADLLAEATQHFPRNVQLSWIRGHWLIQQGEFQDAAGCFESILERGRRRDFGYWAGYDRRLFGELSYQSLAACARGLGRTEESRRYEKLDESLRSRGGFE